MICNGHYKIINYMITTYRVEDDSAYPIYS